MSLPFITLPDGTTRRLGNNPPPDGLVKGLPVFGALDDQKEIPRADWPLYIPDNTTLDDPLLPYVHDQNGIGQCNADATAALIEFCRARQGLPAIKLSAGDLYDRINGGGDNGSLLEDAMHEMLVNGIGTAETAGTLWHRGMQDASAEERGRFKVIEVWTAPTFELYMTGLIKGFAGVSGVWWWDGYAVAQDGWMNPRQSGGKGGHAVFAYKPMRKGTNFGIAHQNSWTPQWGIQGKAVFPESLYHQGGIGGWWLARVVVDEGGIVPIPAAGEEMPDEEEHHDTRAHASKPQPAKHHTPAHGHVRKRQ